jgi:ABC-type amino acid transport substrate-binding protein
MILIGWLCLKVKGNLAEKGLYCRKVFILLFYCAHLFPEMPYSISAEARIVKIGVFEAPPFVMVRDNEVDGLFIEVIRRIGNEQKWELEWVEDTWPRHLEKLQTSDIDLLPCLGYSEERNEIYDFCSRSLYVDSGVIYTRKNEQLRSIFDLSGKKISALKDSIFTKGFQAYMDSFQLEYEILDTKNNIEVMDDIVSGKADAGVCIYSLGGILEKDFPVTTTAISFSPVALYYAVPKGRN